MLSSNEESKTEEQKQDPGQPSTRFAESVNVPLMASLNLSSVLLDPQIGEAFTTKYKVQEEHLYSTSLWGDGHKIRTLDDLQLEMAEEAAAELDANGERDDLSEDEDEYEKRYKAMADKI